MEVPREMTGINRGTEFSGALYLVGLGGHKIYPGHRVEDYDVDGKVVQGTLRAGRTFRGRTDWYVQWDDGIDCVVLIPGLLKKI